MLCTAIYWLIANVMYCYLFQPVETIYLGEESDTALRKTHHVAIVGQY